MIVEGFGPVEMHAIVKGRVQGVGFRATVQHYAEKKGLCGTVKNLVDGTVEIYAQGGRAELEEFLVALKEDAGLGSVESCSTDFYEPKKQHKGFKILF